MVGQEAHPLGMSWANFYLGPHSFIFNILNLILPWYVSAFGEMLQILLLTFLTMIVSGVYSCIRLQSLGCLGNILKNRSATTLEGYYLF